MRKHLFFKVLRRVYRPHEKVYTERFVKYFDQQANDLIYEIINASLKNKSGLMISKFGVTELNCLNCYIQNKEHSYIHNFKNSIQGKYELYLDDALSNLCQNSGFFPEKLDMVKRYCEETLNDVKEIDVLGSYLEGEEYIAEILKNQCIRVNLNGYYAPFLWDKPWTRIMKGKKILVIHPFKKSIESQYSRNRELLFENPDVLPKFSELKVIKAVQSIAGTETKYNNWFEALDSMKRQIDKVDFDIALIGCGAYGMNLASYVKKKGKVAVHLAGWTQMLFGIYGKRWIVDQFEFNKFINKYWIRPDIDEKPSGADKVEGACYW